MTVFFFIPENISEGLRQLCILLLVPHRLCRQQDFIIATRGAGQSAQEENLAYLQRRLLSADFLQITDIPSIEGKRQVQWILHTVLLSNYATITYCKRNNTRSTPRLFWVFIGVEVESEIL